MIIWLVGMSGAGKTVIGRELYARLKKGNSATVLVDGDEVRKIFAQDRSETDYSPEARRRNARRIQEICLWLDRQNIDVVCCILSIFRDIGEQNREIYSQYFEIFVDAPFDELMDRNPKNLYRRALAGETHNVVGIDIDFESPSAPDLHLMNTRPFQPASVMAEEILNAMGRS